MRDDKIADKSDECRKLDERLNKFREKLSFVKNLKDMPLRKRRNSGTSISL
jgi:tetrahydromethanopterin S-methyltransferase subunit G